MSVLSLRTQRLILRPVAYSDMRRIVELVGNFEVVKNLSSVPHPYSIADAEWWIGQTFAYKNGGERAFAIDNGSGMIGAVSLGKPGAAASLGYWLGEPYWGKGYMTEAVAGLANWYFKTSGDDEVLSSALDENTGSINVLAKNGFKATGQRPLYIPSRGQTLPASTFRLVRADYDQRKAAA